MTETPERRPTPTAPTPDLPPPLPWPVRQWLIAFALFGSVLYAGSFALVQPLADIRAAMRAGAIAAVVAWVVFAATLIVRSNARVPTLSWIDLCLLTLRRGVRVLMIGLLLNLALRRGFAALGPWATSLHVSIAILANLLMLSVFVRKARRRGLAPGTALTLFLLALDGTFVVVAVLLLRFVP